MAENDIGGITTESIGNTSCWLKQDKVICMDGYSFHISMPKQNGLHLAYSTVSYISLEENYAFWLCLFEGGSLGCKQILMWIMDCCQWRSKPFAKPSHYLNQWWLDYRSLYASLGLNELTYRGWDKMVIILKTLHSNYFSSMKRVIFTCKCHWNSLVPKGPNSNRP